MDTVINGFLKRNLTEFVDDFIVEIKISDKDYFKIKAENGKVYVTANNYISAFHGIYCYLKKYCNVQYSWCGLIGEYYKNRWAIFYPEAIKILENNGNTKLLKGNNYTKSAKPLFDEVDRKIRAFERKWCETYREYLVPVDTDVVVSAEKYINKWK